MIDTNRTETLPSPESSLISMLTQLLIPLIDRPEAFTVEVVHLPESVTFFVRVAPEDMEKFTGRNERTGRSLGTIVSAVGSRTHQRFFLAFRNNAAGSDSTAESLAAGTRK